MLNTDCSSRKSSVSGWAVISVNCLANIKRSINQQGLCHFVGSPGRSINCRSEMTGMSGLRQRRANDEGKKILAGDSAGIAFFLGNGNTHTGCGDGTLSSIRDKCGQEK